MFKVLCISCTKIHICTMQLTLLILITSAIFEHIGGYSDSNDVEAEPRAIDAQSELFENPQTGDQYIFNNTFLSWNETKSACRNYSKKATLVKIQSKSEAQFVASCFTDSDLGELDYMWIDFLHEDQGKEGRGNPGYCLSIIGIRNRTHQLRRILCRAEKGFICVIRKHPTQKS